MARALHVWAINRRGKNSFRNLRYGPQTRLVRSINDYIQVIAVLTFLFTLSSVKLWSTDMEHSVACLEAKANVCCVKFNPESRYHLSFGSAGKYLCT